MDYDAIIKGTCAGDDVAVAECYSRYRGWLVRLACGYSRSESEDIAQNVLIEIFKNKEACKFVDKPEPMWRSHLRQRLQWRGKDTYRRMKRWPQSSSELVEPATAEPAHSRIEQQEELQQAAQCVQQLPNRLKVVFEMRERGMSNMEIAQEIGVSVPKVHVYYSDAKKALRKLMEGIQI